MCTTGPCPPSTPWPCWTTRSSGCAAAGAQVVLSSGNHDSAQRLGFASRVLAAGGVHVRTDPARVADPVLLEDEHGPVAIYPIPYLEPSLVGAALDLPPDRPATHQGVLTAAMDRIRADLAERPATTPLRRRGPRLRGRRPRERLRAGHQCRRGRRGADRRLRRRRLRRAWATCTAARRSARPCATRGSPIAYSFSEAGQTKGSWLVDLDAEGVRRSTSSPRR